MTTPSAPSSLAVDVGLHDREFIVVEQEVAAARPDDHIEPDARDRPRLADHAAAGRDASLQEIGAELHPVRARALAARTPATESTHISQITAAPSS